MVNWFIVDLFFFLIKITSKTLTSLVVSVETFVWNNRNFTQMLSMSLCVFFVIWGILLINNLWPLKVCKPLTVEVKVSTDCDRWTQQLAWAAALLSRLLASVQVSVNVREKLSEDMNELKSGRSSTVCLFAPFFLVRKVWRRESCWSRPAPSRDGRGGTSNSEGEPSTTPKTVRSVKQTQV